MTESSERGSPFIVDPLITYTSSELRNPYGTGDQRFPMLQRTFVQALSVLELW